MVELLLQRLNKNTSIPGLSPSVIQFETNHSVRGLEWLGPFLYKAIVENIVVLIQYQPFVEPAQEILFHPYLLKEWKNRWYVFGRNGEHKVWNLGLDRIVGIAEMPDDTYLINDVFDPSLWFGTSSV